ncbi:MAG: serine hydrolase [Halieaceae bacterium]|mgnify:FL=1|jgi:CubicO group peptidase (beta-lactamase class C family)|nr:serine hydrolase [Halieaceae bacterium]
MKTYKKVTLLTLTVALGVTTWLATSWQGKQVDHMMGLMDVDRNGMLQIEEVSPLMRLRFIELDSDGDGSIGSSEISAYIRSSLFNVILRKWNTRGLPVYPDNVQRESLQTALDEMVEVLELPGAVMLVGRNGVERTRVMSGDFDANTVVSVASASKWVSSAVLMRLVEQGVLSLDAPLKRYIPELTGHWADTTLRQLLSHSSGASWGHAIENPPSMSYGEHVEQLIQIPVKNEPGVVFAYGGISMQIAGYAAEQASGKRWSQLFDELVATPSEMEQSVYGHPFWHSPGTEIHSPNLAGGLYASGQDYFNFLTTLFPDETGRGLLAKGTIDQMESDLTSSLVQVVPGPRPDWFYGLGLWCEAPLEGRCMQVNSAGAFGTFPWVDRETGTYGVLVTLGSIAEVLPFALNLRRLAIELEG